jgi:hypothetical protein
VRAEEDHKSEDFDRKSHRCRSRPSGSLSGRMGAIMASGP